VVLAICSGGLRRYLAATDELPEKTLVAMAPISVREDVTEGANAVSAMLVPLATDEPNALRRFRKIHNAAIDSKAYTKAVGAARLTDATQVVPFSLAMAASRLYSGMKVARLHRPPFNLVITNVPGPRVPLYLGGARLYNLFGMAPVVDGLGVLIVVTSYINHLTISVTASRGLLPDVDVLLGSIKSSYRELSRAAKAKKQRRAGKKTKRETS
jgi:diacylglycerol O-acyltransferase